MPQLDGLRALAVAGVMIAHWVDPYPFGLPVGSGVHLFFVLSGFLITGNLLDAWSPDDVFASRGQALKNFYARRFLRIFPLYYAALAGAWLLDLPAVRETMDVTLTYLTNFHLFFRNDWHGAIGHLWSLAVEEQFYLVWPVLVLFLPRRFLPMTILAMVLFAPVFRVDVALIARSHHPNLISVLPASCGDTLGLGALLACLLRHPQGELTAYRLARWLLGAGLVGFTVVWLCRWASIQPRLMDTLYTSFLSLIFGWLVLRCTRPEAGWFDRMLSARWLRYVGQISYGIYVLHFFAPAIVDRFEPALNRALPALAALLAPPCLRVACFAVLTFAGAALSWRFLEKPLNDLKRFFPQNASRPS